MVLKESEHQIVRWRCNGRCGMSPCFPSRGSRVRIPSQVALNHPPHGEEAPSHRAEIADLVALRKHRERHGFLREWTHDRPSLPPTARASLFSRHDAKLYLDQVLAKKDMLRA